jgi:hypothetical protein
MLRSLKPSLLWPDRFRAGLDESEAGTLKTHFHLKQDAKPILTGRKLRFN